MKLISCLQMFSTLLFSINLLHACYMLLSHLNSTHVDTVHDNSKPTFWVVYSQGRRDRWVCLQTVFTVAGWDRPCPESKQLQTTSLLTKCRVQFPPPASLVYSPSHRDTERSFVCLSLPVALATSHRAIPVLAKLKEYRPQCRKTSTPLLTTATDIRNETRFPSNSQADELLLNT
jgi:hypothetical protein